MSINHIWVKAGAKLVIVEPGFSKRVRYFSCIIMDDVFKPSTVEEAVVCLIRCLFNWTPSADLTLFDCCGDQWQVVCHHFQLFLRRINPIRQPELVEIDLNWFKFYVNWFEIVNVIQIYNPNWIRVSWTGCSKRVESNWDENHRINYW